MAGYFDGEGCVSAHKIRAITAIVQTGDPEVVKMFHYYFGGRVYDTKRTSQTKRAIKRWIVIGNEAQEFLIYVLPWLRAKRDVALWALGPTYQKSNIPLSEDEKQLRQTTTTQIKAINNRVTING
jgi:hypothetical protein